MRGRKESIIFCETYGIKEWFSTLSGSRINFYCKRSIIFLQLSKIFHLQSIRARTLSDGDLKYSPGIRKRAYELALSNAEKILCDLSCISKINLLGINFELILRKFLVDTLFKRYQFYGLVGQYASEHPHSLGVLYVDQLFKAEELVSIPHIEVVYKERLYFLSYIVSLCVILIYSIFTYLRNRKESEHISESIICQIDGKKSYYMYKELFSDRSNLVFVIDRNYLIKDGNYEYFGNTEADSLNFVYKGLTPNRIVKLKSLTIYFLLFSLKNFPQLFKYGFLYLYLYIEITKGLVQSIDAKNSVYLTCEHLFLPNAVRNELIRADGNLTISIPIGSQIESHFFPSGYQYNYDILCSSGKLQESVYEIQNAITKVILPVGAYEVHKNLKKDEGYFLRIKKLQEFKGQNVSITILTSGIQSETYSGELRLMQLARRLAEEAGIKVFIRPKPLQPVFEYRNSISDVCGMIDSIMITGPEYLLTDFLEVTDLFITFASHSAADICGSGGKIFAINFMNDDAFALWQSEVEGVCLHPETAFDQIMSWVRDSPVGQREVHAQRIKVLSDLIAYKFNDFELYKNNFIRLLDNYLP